MADSAPTLVFADGAAYERFMGRWSRKAGRIFLEWLGLPEGLRWMDAGCGTGALTESIREVCRPGEIVAMDPAPAQISYAQSHCASAGAQFMLGDARSIPFENGRFDAAVSALVLNFIPDRERAVTEMTRVVRPGGIVASYVWDFAGGSGVNQHLNRAIAALEGTKKIGAERYDDSTEEGGLRRLYEGSGLIQVETRPIEITLAFRDFDVYWESNTRAASPGGKYVQGLTDRKRQTLIERVKAILPFDGNGKISYTARVNAVKGTVPPLSY